MPNLLDVVSGATAKPVPSAGQPKSDQKLVAKLASPSKAIDKNINTPSWQENVLTGESGIARKGMIFVFGFLVLFLLWGALFPISSAVVSSGKIVSSGQNKLLQNPTGGVVRLIHTADGATVTAGDLLVELDPAASQAEFSRLSARFAVLSATKRRLEAEDGVDTSVVTNSIGLRGTSAVTKPTDVSGARIEAEQVRELEAGRKRRKAEIAAAISRIGGLEDQLQGLEARVDGAQDLLAYTRMELSKLRPLARDGYVAKNRLWELDKRRLEQTSNVENLRAEANATRQRVAEAEAQLASLKSADQEKRAESITRVVGELAEIRDQLVAAKTALASTEMRAPVDGTVVKLAAHTRGGVISPGAVVAEIVPKGVALETEFRVALNDVNNVIVGQKARIVITAFNRRTYAPVDGKVTYLSADSTVDEATGETYFVARAKMLESSENRTGLSEVQPGMATEVYALATPRVFLSYVLQPVFDSFAKAFREGD